MYFFKGQKQVFESLSSRAHKSPSSATHATTSVSSTNTFYPNTAHLSSRPRRTLQKTFETSTSATVKACQKISLSSAKFKLLSRQFISFSFQWLPPPSPHSKFITNETSFRHSPDTEALWWCMFCVRRCLSTGVTPFYFCWRLKPCICSTFEF